MFGAIFVLREFSSVCFGYFSRVFEGFGFANFFLPCLAALEGLLGDFCILGGDSSKSES